MISQQRADGQRAYRRGASPASGRAALTRKSTATGRQCADEQRADGGGASPLSGGSVLSRQRADGGGPSPLSGGSVPSRQRADGQFADGGGALPVSGVAAPTVSTVGSAWWSAGGNTAPNPEESPAWPLGGGLVLGTRPITAFAMRVWSAGSTPRRTSQTAYAIGAVYRRAGNMLSNSGSTFDCAGSAMQPPSRHLLSHLRSHCWAPCTVAPSPQVHRHMQPLLMPGPAVKLPVHHRPAPRSSCLRANRHEAIGSSLQSRP